MEEKQQRKEEEAAEENEEADEEEEAAEEGDMESQEAEAEEDAEDEEEEEEDCNDESSNTDTNIAQHDARRQECLSRTIFVRNLAFSTSKDTLHSAMRKFGPIKSCVLVTDEASGVSRGSAFIEFAELQSVAEAIKAAEPSVPAELRVSGMQYDSSLIIEGRAAQVSAAVDRKTSSELVSKSFKRKDGQKGSGTDKRNLHLAKEGHITPGSAAAEGVSELDMTKRQQAEAEKKRKLADSNYFVSTTRLSVRNLPATTDNEALKELFLQTAGNGAKVLAAKLVCETDAKDKASNKNGRSKGYGFVEFAEHKHALAALRGVNNNPTLYGKHKRPIVEFAVENVHKVKQLLEKQSKRAADRLERKKDQENSKLLEEKPSKRLKRKEKRKAKQDNETENTNVTVQRSKEKVTGNAKVLTARKEAGSRELTKQHGRQGKQEMLSAQARQDQLTDQLASATNDKTYQSRKKRKQMQQAPSKKRERCLDDLVSRAQAALYSSD